MGYYKPKIVIGQQVGDKWAVYTKGDLHKGPTKLVGRLSDVFAPIAMQGPVVWAKEGVFVVGILHFVVDDTSHSQLKEVAITNTAYQVENKFYRSLPKAIGAILDDYHGLSGLKLQVENNQLTKIVIGTVAF